MSALALSTTKPHVNAVARLAIEAQSNCALPMAKVGSELRNYRHGPKIIAYRYYKVFSHGLFLYIFDEIWATH